MPRAHRHGRYVCSSSSDRTPASKHKYVRWEMEVAREKGCRIIGINLDGSRRVVDATCPPIIRNIGAIFVPFSPKIVAYALENYQMHENDDYHYKDKVYKQLGF